jgi:hypothetical protein
VIAAAFIATILLGQAGPTWHVRADVASKRVLLWVRNNASKPIVFRASNVRWNYAKVAERLPLDIKVPAKSSRLVSFSPADPRVPNYGETVSLEYAVSINGAVTEKGSSGPAPIGSGPGIGLARPNGVGDWQVVLDYHGRTCEFRKVVVKHGARVIYESMAAQTIKAGQHKSLARLPKWTEPFHYSLEWRPSPWAPWFKEAETRRKP